MLEELKRRVCEANLLLPQNGLVTLTWGNVSGKDKESGYIVIKPSGVPYVSMSPEDMVVLNQEGDVVEGCCRPSSDAPTHVYLYQAFPRICGIVHTHSPEATAFAQAERPIPCYGTTHADYFFGSVPCTRTLLAQEIEAQYEKNTGMVIVDTFSERALDELAVPGILVAKHGVFAWGRSPEAAVEHAIVLEEVAKMARCTLAVDPFTQPASQTLMDKHYNRKHGKNAYYGQ